MNHQSQDIAYSVHKANISYRFHTLSFEVALKKLHSIRNSLNGRHFLRLRCSFSIWSFSMALSTSKHSPTNETGFLVWGEQSLSIEEHQRVWLATTVPILQIIKTLLFSTSSFFARNISQKNQHRKWSKFYCYSHVFSLSLRLTLLTQKNLFFVRFSFSEIFMLFTFGCFSMWLKNQL